MATKKNTAHAELPKVGDVAVKLKRGWWGVCWVARRGRPAPSSGLTHLGPYVVVATVDWFGRSPPTTLTNQSLRTLVTLECLGRLAAMVPPPRYPLLRLHGVLGPRHGWRARVVPRPPESHARCTKAARKKAEASGTEEARPQSAAFVEQGAAVVSRGELLSLAAPRGTGEAALVARPDVLAISTLLETGDAAQVAPNILSIAHCNRILGGELYAPLSRVDWATLLRRTFDVDVKSCAACGGLMTVRAVVTDPASIAKLLGALGRPRAPPVAA